MGASSGPQSISHVLCDLGSEPQPLFSSVKGGAHLLTVCEIGVAIKDPLIMEALGSGLKPGATGLRAKGRERQLLAGAYLLLDNTQPQAFSLQKGN